MLNPSVESPKTSLPNQRSQSSIASLESADNIVFVNAGGTIISSWTKSPILGDDIDFGCGPPFHAISGVEPMPPRHIYLIPSMECYRAVITIEPEYAEKLEEGEELFDLQAL